MVTFVLGQSLILLKFSHDFCFCLRNQGHILLHVQFCWPCISCWI